MKDRIAFDRFLKYANLYEEFYRAFDSRNGVAYRIKYDEPIYVDEYFNNLKPYHWIVSAFCWGNHIVQHRDFVGSWGSLNAIWCKALENHDKRYWKSYKLNNNTKVI
jgi:hypothetical protein